MMKVQTLVVMEHSTGIYGRAATSGLLLSFDLKMSKLENGLLIMDFGFNQGHLFDKEGYYMGSSYLFEENKHEEHTSSE